MTNEKLRIRRDIASMSAYTPTTSLESSPSGWHGSG